MRTRTSRRDFLAAGGAAVGTAALAGTARAADGPRVLPTIFEDNIIFVTPRTPAGQTLKLMTDSGGGLFMFEGTAARLGLMDRLQHVKEGQQHLDIVPWPDFAPEAWIPAPVLGGGRFMVVFPAEGEAKSMADRGWDGMLGQGWFRDRVWTFDYPAQSLTLHPGSVAKPAGAAEVPLGFQMERGSHASGFARIQAEIDGATLDLLFDTGAQSALTPAAIQAMGGTSTYRASAFITRTTFDGWRARHPDWPVVVGGEANMHADMIRVDNVRVGGFDTGPTWFAARADTNFTQWMSQWTDKPIVGALGGAALHHFRVTADYPAGKAFFEKA
jgi:hypothetical protein